MPRLWRRLFWPLALSVVAGFLWWQSRSDVGPPADPLSLPDNPPDLYIEGLNQTRFDPSGHPSMRTRAESLAYYEDRAESLIQAPVVRLLNTTRPDWRVESETATLFNNGDTVFERDVIARELTEDTPSVLETDWLKVERQGAFVTTPRPVKLTQGRQLATGVGMDADLAADDPVITLKSEVAIRYEANSP